MSDSSFKSNLQDAFNSDDNNKIIVASVNGVTISAYVFLALFIIFSFVTAAILIKCGTDDDNTGYVGVAVTTLMMGLVAGVLMGILLYYIMRARRKVKGEITSADISSVYDLNLDLDM